MKMKKMNPNLFKKAAFTAAVLTATAAGGFAYAMPVSYVSLDVNPSVEYSLNMFDRVLSVKAVKEEGKEIVVDLDVENKGIEKAVQKTIDKLIEAGYLTSDENAGVIISISNSDEEKAEKLSDELEGDTQEYIDSKGEKAEVEAEAVGKTRVEQAKLLGVTPGKLNLVEKLVKSTDNPDEITEDQFKDMLEMSVKDINKTIKENRKELKNETIKETDEDATAVEEDEDNSDDSTAADDKAQPQDQNGRFKKNNPQNGKNGAKQETINADVNHDDTDDEDSEDSVEDSTDSEDVEDEDNN
jgi:hypothetical protein